jgi:hypothetical protein
VLGSSNPTSLALSSTITFSGTGEDWAGRSVAIGDVNGDGYGDILIGAPLANSSNGTVYLVLGSNNPTSLDLSSAITFSGLGGEEAGASVAIGDVNGDGYGDILIGAPLANSSNGTVYLVLGSSDLSSNNLSNAISLSGSGGEEAGSVAVGDVNGDGYGDMLIGAPKANSSNGNAYLVLGNSSLTSYDLSNAFTFSGSESEEAGGSVAIGDVNGDGYGDMLIGAPKANSNDGVVYSVLGSSNPSSLTLSNATTFIGSNTGYTSSVATGDVNGDGLGDILIGAAFFLIDRIQSGKVYLVLGNQIPGLNSSSNSVTYNEGVPYAVLNPSLQVQEYDTQIVGATIQITDNYQAGEDTLKALSLHSNISSLPFNTTTGTLTLTGAASVADYQAVLEQVAYVNSAENPDISPRMITFQVNDGRLCGMSNTFKQTLSIEGIKPPVSPSSSPSSGSSSGSRTGISSGMLALAIALPVGILALLMMLSVYFYRKRTARNRYNFFSVEPIPEGGEAAPLHAQDQQMETYSSINQDNDEELLETYEDEQKSSAKSVCAVM